MLSGRRAEVAAALVERMSEIEPGNPAWRFGDQA